MVMLLLQAVSRIRTRIHLTAENSYDSIVPQMVRDGLIFDLNAFRRPKEVTIAKIMSKKQTLIHIHVRI